MYATGINLRHNYQALIFSIVVSAWNRQSVEENTARIVKAFGGINVQASMGPHEPVAIAVVLIRIIVVMINESLGICHLLNKSIDSAG